SLKQFARSTAAYIRGFQQHYGVDFYAISIQNELNFEQYYNSMTYPRSSQYIAAIKAIRAEFDRYEDLKNIRLMGPEDLWGVMLKGCGNNVLEELAVARTCTISMNWIKIPWLWRHWTSSVFMDMPGTE